jgi:hypothetical protein
MKLYKRLTTRIKAVIVLYMRYADADQPSIRTRFGDLNAGIAGDLRRRSLDA